MSELRTWDVRSEVALAMLAARHALDSPGDNSYTPDLSAVFSQRLLELDDAQKRDLADHPGGLAIQQLAAFMPQDWENYHAWSVSMEMSYLSLLGRGEYEQAQHFAQAMTGAMRELALPGDIWRERSGDTALLLHQPQAAIEHYDSVDSPASRGRVTLKLADAYFLLDDHAQERVLRESIYRNFSEE